MRPDQPVYRCRVLGTNKLGPWRGSREEAIEDGRYLGAQRRYVIDESDARFVGEPRTTDKETANG